MAAVTRPVRPLRWIGSSHKDYAEFPQHVKEAFGFGLYLAQTGQHPLSAKPLKGLGSGIVELVEAYDGDAFRTVYTVRFETAVYVLHCFKRSQRAASRRHRTKLTLSGAGCVMPRPTTPRGRVESDR